MESGVDSPTSNRDMSDSVVSFSGSGLQGIRKSSQFGKLSLDIADDEDSPREGAARRDGAQEEFDVNVNQTDYCIEIIGVLWSLLDEPGDH